MSMVIPIQTSCFIFSETFQFDSKLILYFPGRKFKFKAYILRYFCYFCNLYNMNQCFKMFSHVSVIHITPNHGQFLLRLHLIVLHVFNSILKLCFVGYFSQSTVILSQVPHSNDWQQLKLACILNAYEQDWLS